jgi:hypothetical protein
VVKIVNSSGVCGLLLPLVSAGSGGPTSTLNLMSPQQVGADEPGDVGP